MVFYFTVYLGDGMQVTGSVDARNEEQAERRLREKLRVLLPGANGQVLSVEWDVEKVKGQRAGSTE